MSQTQASAHITSQSLLIPTLKAWRLYLEDQGNSLHTVKAFIADLQLFASFLSPDRTLGSISTSEINGFLEWMQKGRKIPCSPKTLSRRITSIKAFFRWLHQKGVILINPSEKVLQKSVISPLPEVLTSTEIDAIFEIAQKHRSLAKPDARPYTLVALLLYTGIKKGECLSLSKNHVELEGPSGAYLFVRYANPQYRYKERKIQLPGDWVEAFKEYARQYDVSNQLLPWSPRRLEYILEDIGNEAGLSKHLSFDMCRWTCALLDWGSGMERDQIRQKLGISKVQWREIGMKLDQLASAIN